MILLKSMVRKSNQLIVLLLVLPVSQDLSVAGLRKGMKHEAAGDEETTRSGLFYEAVRVIKEMREHDERCNGRTDQYVRPRFGLYENVPGALSSGKDKNGKPLKGEDFRCVLEELAKIVKEDAVIPRPDGQWSYTGCIMGDSWSIAWSVHDSQHWGVPQRRKRLCVLIDFAGFTAPDILFGTEYRRSTERTEPNEAV